MHSSGKARVRQEGGGTECYPNNHISVVVAAPCEARGWRVAPSVLLTNAVGGTRGTENLVHESRGRLAAAEPCQPITPPGGVAGGSVRQQLHSHPPPSSIFYMIPSGAGRRLLCLPSRIHSYPAAQHQPAPSRHFNHRAVPRSVLHRGASTAAQLAAQRTRGCMYSLIHFLSTLRLNKSRF